MEGPTRLVLLVAFLVFCCEARKKSPKEAEAAYQKRVVDLVLKAYEQDDLYAMLNTNIRANEKQLKEAWRRMSLATHPDKNHDVRAETAFDMVQDA